MIEIEDAWVRIERHVRRNETVELDLQQAVGRVLATQLDSDSDSPPFSKSLVDGFAVGSPPGGTVSYLISEIVTAGNVPTKTLSAGQATQIMTGAPIPEGSIGVIMVEETQVSDDGRIIVTSTNFSMGQNILNQGRVVSKSEKLLDSGHRLRAHHVGALAEFGINRVDVVRKTNVAVLVTGDELVPIDETPGPGQIRNSNGSLIASMIDSAGGEATILGVGRDNMSDLLEKIAIGLQHDILVIAGGVSAGVLDLVPKCLTESSVKQDFHKINLKPGKPLWFGTRTKNSESDPLTQKQDKTLVFGLPGNPVSTLVCFKLFVEPIIRRLDGGPKEHRFYTGSLSDDFHFTGGRRTFWPCRFARRPDTEINDREGRELEPLPWIGSSDQVRFLYADALVEFAGERQTFHAGDTVRYVKL